MNEMVDKVAKAVYDSHQFKKPWEHKDTKRIWRSSCRKTARFIIKVIASEPPK